MGWFDEQIRQRKKEDADSFSEVLYDIAGAVNGKQYFYQSGTAKNEIGRILEYYGVKSRDLPNNFIDLDSQIEYLIRPHGIMKRTVRLTSGWSIKASYPMLAKLKDGSLTALIPGRYSGYFYTDSNSGKSIKVSKKSEELFEEEAYCFYKPYPTKKLSEKELVNNIFSAISMGDIALYTAVSLISLIIAMLIPCIYRIVFNNIASETLIQPLFFATLMLICVVVSTNLLTVVKKMLSGRIKNKLEISCESAVMMRILSLPTSFFREYSAGELASKIQSATKLCSAISEVIISVGITTLISLIYFVWIGIFTPALLLPAAITVLSILVLTIAMIAVRTQLNQKQMKIEADEQGISYSLISGITKIKIVGGEIRAFSKWGKIFAEKAKIVYNPPLILKLGRALNIFLTVLGSAWIYYTAAKSGVTSADFYAFSTAYGVMTGAIAMFFETSEAVSEIKPGIKNIMTFFKEEPEISNDKQTVINLSGNIELNNVTFKYNENNTIIKNLSIKIHSGEYIAIVGKTGCGKSTLIRLLLGFEVPQKGAVYYDGKELSKLDLKSLRQKIGIVLQNGKLFSGDIFSNISITAPNLTLDEAWEAAEKAGIADDIRNMPMGMNTIISEGGGGISGGQRQRILIARAIAAKPKIIIFDEATSALDNITQKIISDSLDNLNCTRIVVAHRLSTIKQCNRIIVLDQGKIAEDGTYDELIEMKGLFAELINRQKIN